MRFCSAVLVISQCFLWSGVSAADDTITDPVAKQLYELGLEYKKLEEVRSRAFPADGGKVTNDDLSDEEWLRQDRATEDKVPLPDTVLLPEFFALAKKHPTSPFAFDALAFVIRRGGPATGDVEGKPWQIKEQAIDLMLENHMDDPRIAHVFDILDGSLPSRKTEAFLRHAIENGSEPITRAAASVGLARYFHTFATVHKRSRQLKGKVRLLNYERFWNIVITPYLEEEFPYDQEQVSAEIERLLIQVIEEYRDIMAIDWKVSGPSKVFISTEAFVEPKTYGEMARSLMFELNSLVPGKKAPDIEGTDAEGKKFRLSDYEGKVVLLTFSANWCGGCVKLYPLQRNLVDKFRNEPFVLLSVSLDESVETLQASTTSGEITWRCWWDGENGPISKAWNRHGVPSLVLLDHQHVIQDVLLNRYTLQEDFENEIETLIAKISPKKAVSQ